MINIDYNNIYIYLMLQIWAEVTISRKQLGKILNLLESILGTTYDTWLELKNWQKTKGN